MNLTWPRYHVTATIDLAGMRAHAEHAAKMSGLPQLVVHPDGTVEVIGEQPAGER